VFRPHTQVDVLIAANLKPWLRRFVIDPLRAFVPLVDELQRRRCSHSRFERPAPTAHRASRSAFLN
jgi:hypothetical protein